MMGRQIPSALRIQQQLVRLSQFVKILQFEMMGGYVLDISGCGGGQMSLVEG